MNHFPSPSGLCSVSRRDIGPHIYPFPCFCDSRVTYFECCAVQSVYKGVGVSISFLFTCLLVSDILRMNACKPFLYSLFVGIPLPARTVLVVTLEISGISSLSPLSPDD